MPPQNAMCGILFRLAAVLLFVFMQILVKAQSDRFPPGQIVFFRSFFALPVIVTWLAASGQMAYGLRIRSPVAHVWRGLVGTSAMGLGFAALGLLPLPEVTAIGYATPLLVVAFASMFLGERVGPLRFAAVALGLAGVLIVLSPRLGGLDRDVAHAETLGAVLMLMSAVCAALAQVFVRNMVRTEHAAAIVFWFSVTASVLALTTLPWGWTRPTAGETTVLVSIGLLGGTAQIFLTSAYRYADASLVAPFDYASMLFAIAAGYFIFAEVPTRTVLAGAVLVVAAGILIIWSEHRLRMERGRARGATGGQKF